MEIKSISYQRVLNLRDYNSKRLELFAEVKPGENADVEISNLMKKVEEKIREDAAREIEEKISNLREELEQLRTQVSVTKSQIQHPSADETSW